MDKALVRFTVALPLWGKDVDLHQILQVRVLAGSIHNSLFRSIFPCFKQLKHDGLSMCKKIGELQARVVRPLQYAVMLPNRSNFLLKPSK